MKYQKVAECPSMLQEWFELINSVPFGGENYLRSWEILVSNIYFELTGEDARKLQPPPPELDYGEWRPPSYEQQEAYDKAFDNAIESLKEKTRRFSKLYSYLFEMKDYPAPQNIYDEISYKVRKWEYEKTAYQRYEKFQQMRIDVRTIARSCMLYRKKGRFISNELTFERLGFKRRDKGYRSDFIIKNGKIDFESELIQVLRGIDAERLRICPICDEVFWAKRIDAPTCPKKRCSNNFHQRKLRIKELESRLDVQWSKLEKQRKNLPPNHVLTKEQTERVNKITSKINKEKMKNGNL